MPLETAATHLFRLKPGSDILQGLTRACQKRGINFGVINAIGLATKVKLGFYDHVNKQYVEHTFDHGLEILNLTANVSLKDGQPFIHAHMTVADDQGRTYGGHVFQGCTVFVLEATVTELTGDGPVRAYDDETGLFMWPAE